MIELTPREQELVILLASHLKHHGITPSYEELRVTLGLKSKHGIMNLVDALIRKGFARRTAGDARAIELLPSEYYHAPDCMCSACAEAKYLRRLELVHALEMPAPGWMRAVKTVGFKPLSNFTRTCWRLGFPYHPDERAKPRMKSSNFHSATPSSQRGHRGV